MTPVVEKIRQENKDVHSIDLSKEMHMANIFGVMGTPATVLVSGNRIQKYVLGARSEKFIRDLILPD